MSLRRTWNLLTARIGDAFDDTLCQLGVHNERWKGRCVWCGKRLEA
jgi:hypothetical protein